MQNDNPIVIKRIKNLQEAEVSRFNTLLDEGTVWDSEQGTDFLSNDQNALFVAYWQNEVVGFLTAHRLQRFDKRKAEVLLYEISVSEDYQRKGVGTALINEAKIWAKQVDADEVWVLTNKSNIAARSLYKSAGGITEDDDEQMFVIKI